MGTVLRDEMPAAAVFSLPCPRPGTVYRRIVDGAESFSTVLGTAAFTDRFSLPADGGLHFVRGECYDENGRLMLFTNPIYRIPRSAPLRERSLSRAVDRVRLSRVFITRHGQVLPDEYYDSDADFPVGNPDLTPLGRQQAQCLAGYLREQGFHGVIYASPYRRTMETAEVVAQAVDCPIVVLPCIRERVKERGCFVLDPPEELLQRYPHTQRRDALWTEPLSDDEPEEYSDVVRRVRAGVAGLPVQGDVLFVGHGSSVAALMAALRIPMTTATRWNCSLAIRDGKTGKVRPYVDGFIPPEWRTSNRVSMAEEQQKGMEYRIPNAAALSRKGKCKVLHIGDTLTRNYAFYRQLIETVDPDIILHTGDLADEVKAGRCETDRAVYPEKIRPLMDALLSFKKPVWIVPGNNDVVGVLSAYEPAVRLLEPDTVLTLEGVRVCMVHRLCDIHQAAEVYLYGHGYSGDDHMLSDNARPGPRYYNACSQSFVHFFGEGKSCQVFDPLF